MKSKIKFIIHISINEIKFLDITVSVKHRKLGTTLFNKPTNSHSNYPTFSLILSGDCNVSL